MSSFGERAAELSGLAAALLGWRPSEFWEATPVEFAAALGAGASEAELVDRESLHRLLNQFPDNREK